MPHTQTRMYEPPARIELPQCVHLGDPVRFPVAPDNVRDWRRCDRGYGVVCPCQQCKTCPEYAGTEPDRVTRIDPQRLFPHPEHLHLNPSLCRHGGKFLMAYRCGWWNARIHLAELGSDLQPTRHTTLKLDHPFCAVAQEDPRLFIHRNRLHLAFAGLEPIGESVAVHVMLAELGDDLQVQRVWYPHYSQRTVVEKNWAFFSHEDELHCVYSTHPEHKILRIGDIATLAYRTPTPSHWTGGFIRGGASPVLHDGEYYHFFHGWRHVHGNHHTYSIGVLTFEARPPFRVTRMTRAPIQTADERIKPTTAHHKAKSIIFPCGAVHDSGKWLVSYGHHDQWCEISEFDEIEIERELVKVQQ